LYKCLKIIIESDTIDIDKHRSILLKISLKADLEGLAKLMLVNGYRLNEDHNNGILDSKVNRFLKEIADYRADYKLAVLSSLHKEFKKIAEKPNNILEMNLIPLIFKYTSPVNCR
jgi:hypothetical protein